MLMKMKKTCRQPIERISADPEVGLTKDNVNERIDKGYTNIATDPNEKSTAKIIATNLFTFFNTVLFSIAAVFIVFMVYLTSIGRSDVVDKYFGFSKFVFLIPAIMNVAMGSFQEIKSLKVIKRLRIVTSTKNKVIRDSKLEIIDASQVVLDDIVAVSAGEQATADLIVLSGEVDVDESMLTGESDYVKKSVGDTILSGSSVIVGSAKCRADKIGDDTYAAELTRKVKSSSRHKSELMTSIIKIIKFLTVCLIIVSLVVTGTMIFKITVHGADSVLWGGMTLSLDDPVSWSLNKNNDGMFGVGIIPTGLVLTTAVALLVSIAQLTKKQTLVQELYSLENLSRVDVICLDKTGTLTDGTMTVSDVKPFIPIEEVRKHVRTLMYATDDRNATSEAVFKYFGAEEKAEFKEFIPFSSETKYSGIIYNDGKKLLMGAPDYLIPENDDRLGYVTERASKGNRVIAVTLDGKLIALIAIEDHIRDTAADTLKFFRENNVTVKVISGDSPLTVSIIAQKCGIVNAEKYISLADVPLEKIPEIAEEYTVFARVSPEQKEALVQALQSKGHKVAMTGDGVNDILALRRADSSITFAKATEAAKSCSDVVLLDNDFSHLKEVVGEGRRVIGNTQKTTVLYLMKSIAVCIFAFALIPFAKGQFWFSIENMYMLEAAVIGTGGFLISLEPRRTPVKGSFMKNIVTQSISAGILAACAIVLPIALNAAPKFLGYTPFVSDENVGTMMTVLTTIAGFVVVFSMCIPFNRYRAITLACISGVTAVLGLMLPTSYIGGKPVSAPMLAYDEAAGQTIFDCQLFKEMFQPWNSQVIRDLNSDINNYIVLRLFLYAAIPTFILIRFALENYARREFKDLKLNRTYRVGRRLMLASSFVLMLRAILSVLEIVPSAWSIRHRDDAILYITLLTINAFFAGIHIAIGVIGYKIWKDKNPRPKRVKFGFASGIVLFVISVLPMIFSGELYNLDDPRYFIDSVLVFIITTGYIIGSLIVRVSYKKVIPEPERSK